jgi:ribosomal protein S18 acetylase RimI-like enzyme
VVKTLLAPLFRVLETVRDDDFYILAIAIDRDARRTGVGSSLMADAEDRARAVALPRLSLDVSAKNHGAIRLYEGLGFTVEWQWPERVPLPGVKLYRMVKTLPSS